MSEQVLPEDLDEAIRQHHASVDEFARGSSRALELLYSRRDDVTLGNPFGPFVRGFDQVARTMELAAEHYREGEAIAFEEIARYVGPDLACTVEVERLKDRRRRRTVARLASVYDSLSTRGRRLEDRASARGPHHHAPAAGVGDPGVTRRQLIEEVAQVP